MMLQIEISNLNKKYGKKEVIKNLNLHITNDQYNFITGANGTGKSTLIKCINGIINYHGYINNNQYTISYCPEKVMLPEFITLKNFLLLLAKTNKIPHSSVESKLNEYINKFNINQYVKTPIIKLSQGTRQKILLIQSIIKEADVYIFDEPLTGLDKDSQNIFFNELSKLKDDKKLILIITHQITKYPFDNINKIELNNA